MILEIFQDILHFGISYQFFQFNRVALTFKILDPDKTCFVCGVDRCCLTA